MSGYKNLKSFYILYSIKCLFKSLKKRLFVFISLKSLILIITLHISAFYSNAYADDYSTRPTSEAVTEDLAYCAPMYAELIALYYIMYKPMPYAQKILAAAAVIAAYALYRSKIEGWALEYQDNSYVVNHSDFNDDMINDYAKWVNLDAINNTDKYAQYLTYDATRRRLENVSLCEDLVGKFVTRTDPDNGFVYYEKTLTESDVLRLEGCRYCVTSVDNDAICSNGGTFHGFTYEIYNQDYFCDGGVYVHLKTTGAEKCIMKGNCDRIDSGGSLSLLGFTVGDYLVCAYKMDEMICSEAVSCSFSMFGTNEGTELDGDTLDRMGEFFTGLAFDYSAIDARTSHGKDPRDPGIPAIITCQQLVDDSAEGVCLCTVEQAGNSLCDVDSFYTCSNDNITTVETCSICGNFAECIDERGLFIEGCVYPENQLCGYYPNEEYLLHCALEKDISMDSAYEMPEFISKYCTGEAIVDNGNMSVTGRIMRCVELSIQNMFYGAYEEADGRNITGIYCSNDDSSVSLRSECEAGIFIQFQNRMIEVVRLLMALSISMLGVMILFGLIQDVKSILHYIMTFGLVFYFAVSDGWREGYYDAAVTAGRTMGMILGSNLSYNNLYNVELNDGCDYQIVTSRTDDNMLVIGNNDYEYPDNEAHYAIWDSYDCKMEKFFSSNGGGSFSSFSKISNAIIPFGFIIAFIVVLCLFVFILIFVFFSTQFLVFALTAFFVLTLLIFISPIIIPLALLKNVQKAKAIFDTWLKTLIAYSFQPLVIWSVLAIMNVFIDFGLYGKGDIFVDKGQNQIAEIKDDCSVFYLPCVFHKLDIGYYDPKPITSFASLWKNLLGVTLMKDVGLAFLGALFFIGIIFFMAMSGMQIIAQQLFDAAENADLSQEIKGMQSLLKIGAVGAMKSGQATKNTLKYGYQKLRYGVGKDED